MKLSFILIVLLASCNMSSLDTKKSGLHRTSRSIEDSKKNGVFLFQLKVDNPIINIGSEKTDTVRQMWVESDWVYADNGQIKRDSTSQIALLLGNSSNNYSDNFLLEYHNRYFGWNGVFFASYVKNDDAFYVIGRNNNKTIFDTIFFKK